VAEQSKLTKNLGAMRMGVRLYRWFNLPRQFWTVFNVNAKLEIFFQTTLFSVLNLYVTIPYQKNETFYVCIVVALQVLKSSVTMEIWQRGLCTFIFLKNGD
jgi:hypothetical protein